MTYEQRLATVIAAFLALCFAWSAAHRWNRRRTRWRAYHVLRRDIRLETWHAVVNGDGGAFLNVLYAASRIVRPRGTCR